jgi:hypothetical protein
MNRPKKATRLDPHTRGDDRDDYDRFDHTGEYIPRAVSEGRYPDAEVSVFDWVRWVRTNRTPQTARARAVLMALVLHVNIDGECFPTVATLAAVSCYSRRTVQRALQELEADGFIRCRRSRDGLTSTRYSFWRTATTCSTSATRGRSHTVGSG